MVSRRTSFASSISSRKNSVEVNGATNAQPQEARRNSVIKSAWTEIKEYAREHHRAANGAFESLYGIGVVRYGPNGERLPGLYQPQKA